MRFNIKSRLPSFLGQRLTPHVFREDNRLGIDVLTPGLGVPVFNVGTIGVEHGEPFALSFQNDTSAGVEVRFSIDGIDILTGSSADLELSGQRMWAPAYRGVELEAWPESTSGGGRFVFAPEGMAVADHRPTGSPKGIICAAVFIEMAAPRPPSPLRGMDLGAMEGELGRAESFSYGGGRKGGGPTRGGESPMRGVGTGIGEHVAQTLTTVDGLRQPKLHSIFMIKVVFWEELRARLLANSAVPTMPPDFGDIGFPGQKPFRGPDMSGIPRMPAVREPQRLG